MNKKDVKILSKRTLFAGFMGLEEYCLQHKRFAGDWTEPLTRELLCRRPAVGVLLVDPERETLVMIEEFRVGCIESEDAPWLCEVVAGLIDEGESAEQAAVREVREETGLQVTDLQHVMEYWVSPGGSNEHVSLWVGRVDSRQAGGFHGHAEEQEDIRVFTLGYEEAFAAMQQGKINNALAIIALQWLRLNQADFAGKLTTK